MKVLKSLRNYLTTESGNWHIGIQNTSPPVPDEVYIIKMAQDLPYFRFTVQEWQNGKITLESYELQGLFINVCGYYWISDCNLTLAMLEKKFRDAKAMLKELIDLGILKHEKRHDKIEIEFLNKQYDLLSEKRKLRQIAGSKGGNAKAKLKQKGSYKDKDNNKDKDNKGEVFYFYDDYILDLKYKEYLAFRKQIKKPLSEISIKANIESLKKLSKGDNDTAIKILDQSIANGWQGLFELKESKQSLSPQSRLEKFISAPTRLDKFLENTDNNSNFTI